MSYRYYIFNIGDKVRFCEKYRHCSDTKLVATVTRNQSQHLNGILTLQWNTGETTLNPRAVLEPMPTTVSNLDEIPSVSDYARKSLIRHNLRFDLATSEATRDKLGCECDPLWHENGAEFFAEVVEEIGKIKGEFVERLVE